MLRNFSAHRRTWPHFGEAVNVEDLRRIARRRLPAGDFDYIDGCADDQRTLAANRDAYAAIEFRLVCRPAPARSMRRRR
jgi:hypothetical protein